MLFQVTAIEFDFESDDEYPSLDYQREITEDAISIWAVEDEEDLVDKISDAYGWCIKNINYQHLPC